MTTVMSIRELTRNGNMFNEYDYIDIEDKKSNEYKGVFISSKYADEVKEFLEKKIMKEKQAKIDAVMEFVGNIEMLDEFKDKDIKEIRKLIAKKKSCE